jgi:hypothetical protein
MSNNKQELEVHLKEVMVDSQALKDFMISLKEDNKVVSKTLLEIFLRNLKSSLEEVLEVDKKEAVQEASNHKPKAKI